MSSSPDPGTDVAQTQHKPELAKATPGDFMRPAVRTRANTGPQANGVGVQVEDTKICVVMVGLPARGKSLIAQKGRTANARLRHWIKTNRFADSNLSGPLSWMAEYYRQVFQCWQLPPHGDTTTERVLFRHFEQRRREIAKGSSRGSSC